MSHKFNLLLVKVHQGFAFEKTNKFMNAFCSLENTRLEYKVLVKKQALFSISFSDQDDLKSSN